MKRNLIIFGGRILSILFAIFLTACGSGGGGGGETNSYVPPEPNYEGYKVYMNNLTPEQVGSIVGEGPYVGGWDHVQEAFQRDNWIYIGEATTTQTFLITSSYEYIMILWERVGIKFDSFENLTSGASFGYDSTGSYAGYFYTDSNLTYDEDINNILGPPDGKFITANDGGTLLGAYIFFRIPGDFHGTTNNPEEFRVTFQNYK